LLRMAWNLFLFNKVQSLLGFVPVGSDSAFRLYHLPPDNMLLCTHVDDLLLSAAGHVIANRLYLHYGLHHRSKFSVAGTFVGIDIIRHRAARCNFLSQATLIDRLLEHEFSDITSRNNLTGNGLRYNPGKELNK
jgi:hypothetical protein